MIVISETESGFEVRGFTYTEVFASKLRAICAGVGLAVKLVEALGRPVRIVVPPAWGAGFSVEHRDGETTFVKLPQVDGFAGRAAA